MKTTILPTKHSTKRVPCQFALLIPLAFACFALAPQTQATCQDACLTNRNTVQGEDALISLFRGSDNTAIGFSALLNNTDGIGNTANGSNTLVSNTTGVDNTAIGYEALFSNTTGNRNTAAGAFALQLNTTGFDNTAIGSQALFSNTTGALNTATGWLALAYNTIGNDNTANGYEALMVNTTGGGNTAVGLQALYLNTTANDNTANGYQSLYHNTTGNYNTANGQGSLYGNTTGHNNTATGQNALGGNTTGNNNIALGSNAGINLTTGSNNIDIFDRGVAGEANTIRVGRQGTQTATFIAGISGAAVSGSTVTVNSNGQLGVAPSSKRFKQNIQRMGETSEALEALQPVTFQYKAQIDPKGTPQFGLVAEEVEKVAPELVTHDEQGKPYTVRYEAVNAMLLNEFLKEHRKVQELEANAVRQQKQIEALTGSLQKVSAQLATVRVRPIGGLELSKSAPQTVQK